MDEINTIINYWFPKDTNIIPTIWFSKTKETDDYIRLHFNELLILAESHQLNNWKSTTKGHLALIIILDQFSRHIYRDTEEQYKNDIIAFHYAQEFLLEKKDTDLSILEKMMILMPYRHQENIQIYEFIIKYLEFETDPLWDKFKKHTHKNYEYLCEHNKLPNRIEYTNTFQYDQFIDILENPWEYCDATIKNTSLVTTLHKFILSKISNKESLIIVSLSGGVDSMVILSILNYLKNLFKLKLDIVAVHLDYHNRSETGFEAEFLFRWCQLIKVPLYYRYIHEGIRNSKDRKEYEDMTKEIRFNIYKKVQDIYSSHNKIGVILGHHKGDLQENVFFNLMKGRNLTDLSVIKEEAEIMGVNILRPLINHPKSDIFNYAEKNNIPYFKNTTPEWSNRGKYRNIIEPALIDTFGNSVLNSLSKISKESDELYLIIKSNIIEPYFKTIVIKENQHYLPKIINQPFTYWKYIFHEWCHINNIGIIPHKLLSIIYDKINQNNTINITCSISLKITITDKFIIINLC